MKFLVRHRKRIDVQFSALNKNTNLAGRFRFRFTNGVDDAIVVDLAEKFFCSHRAYQLDPAPPPPKLPPPPLNPLKPPPPDDQPPPPDGKKIGPPRREE